MRAKLVALVAVLAPALATADPGDPDVEAPAPQPVAKRASPRRFYLVAGVAYVDPLSSSRELELAGVDGTASLAVQNGPIAGSGAAITSTTVAAGILGYRLQRWGGRFSLETLLGAPLSVKMHATGTLANKSIAPSVLGIPTGIMPLGSELGEAKGAPPMLTLVYSLVDHGALRPYVGAGVSVLFAYDAHVTNPTLAAIGKPDFSIAPAPGVVAQAGVDATIYGRVYARVDVKFIGLMLARGEVHNIQIAAPDLPLFGNVSVGTAKMDVWVNPLIVQAGIGTDF